MASTAELTASPPVAVGLSGVTLARGGRTLFSAMTWELPPGKFLAVTGPSGSGKTSLLACLRGTLHPTSGTAQLSPSEGMSVGTVFQHLRLAAESSVLTNVLCGRLGGYPWWRSLFGFTEADRQKAYEICAELGLSRIVHKAVKNISGGERQRTAIARALFQTPRILLADEPTSNLDRALAVQVLERFRRLSREEGCCVISVLHERELVEQFADHELSIGTPDGCGWSFRTIG